MQAIAQTAFYTLGAITLALILVYGIVKDIRDRVESRRESHRENRNEHERMWELIRQNQHDIELLAEKAGVRIERESHLVPRTAKEG